MKKERSRSREVPLIFEKGGEGRVGCILPELDVPRDKDACYPEDRYLRDPIRGFPQASQVEVARHYTGLSNLNYGVDTGFYPLGSCTMKYNPKINEAVARLPGFLTSHPYFDTDQVQGNLDLLYCLEQALCEITGMAGFTLQPAAGAHGELTGMLILRAYMEEKGEKRKKILIPDSAHGTNPSSAIMAGFQSLEIKSNEKGRIDLDFLQAAMDGDTAGLMLTNPNTLGIFEKDIFKIAEIVHGKGGLIYCDGANMNALMGIARPGDMGTDILHLNLHKTFSTPHGGGGPGAGPVGVSRELLPFLPKPVVRRKENGRFFLDYDMPHSIGRVRAFNGQFGVLVRALAYILALGRENLKRTSEVAVLNANYIRAGLKGVYHLPYKTPVLHEVIFSDKKQLKEHGIRTLDIAKRLMDYGFHPPTIYFPLVVKGALMIEPTEAESREGLDAFIRAMKEIAEEAAEDPDYLRGAPYHTPYGRLDEVAAAKKPVLRWKEKDTD